MVAVVVHDIVGCDEGGHIAACLGRQVGVDGPIVLCAACTFDGLGDVVGAAVVAGDDQRPVAENAIEVAQVASGGIAGLDGVAPLVDEACHLQPVLFACAYHELPKTYGSGSAHGCGVECALDDGQVSQFQRHLVAFEGFLEDGVVEIAGTQQNGHGVAQAVAVEVDVLLHHIVVGHVDDVGQAAQATGVGCGIELGVLSCRLAALVEEEVVACLPFLQQAVYFLLLHALRQDEGGVIAQVVVVCFLCRDREEGARSEEQEEGEG